MKNITIIILLLQQVQIFSQASFPRIEKVVVNDKLFHGQIDKYPITIYLKYNRYSNYHAGVYSVEGWYYSDKIRTKIPLTGLCDYPEVVIYNFQDTAKSNELLNFLEMKRNHWEDMEYYKNLQGYKEKFVISESENYWTNDDKKLDLIFEKDDFAIINVSEFLILDSATAFDLHNFGGWIWNFDIVAHESGKFILKFEHSSRLFVMGQCGAGLEKGFFQLDFDKDNKLVQYEEFVYESCNSSISNEELDETNSELTIYHCYDYANKKSFDISVNVKELKIEKIEKN